MKKANSLWSEAIEISELGSFCEWITVKPENLLFDVNNPRFFYGKSSGGYAVTDQERIDPDAQRKVFFEIKEKHKIEVLVESILKIGLVDISPMFVQEISNSGQYVVFEGNRRLAAIRHILANESDYRDKYASSLETLKKIEVVKISEPEKISILLRARNNLVHARPEEEEKELRSSLQEISTKIESNPSDKEKYDTVKRENIRLKEEIRRLEEKENPSPSQKIKNLTSQGETKTVEFKETLGLDVQSQKAEKYIEESALKTVVAFLNSEGGELLIGVADDGQINGINAEVEKLHKKSTDKFLLHFKNRLKDRIGQGFYPLVEYDLIKVEEVHVLHIQAKKSDQECYLDNRYFYVRSGPSTDKLEGPKLVAYIKNRSAN